MISHLLTSVFFLDIKLSLLCLPDHTTRDIAITWAHKMALQYFHVIVLVSVDKQR